MMKISIITHQKTFQILGFLMLSYKITVSKNRQSGYKTITILFKHFYSKAHCCLICDDIVSEFEGQTMVVSTYSAKYSTAKLPTLWSDYNTRLTELVVMRTYNFFYINRFINTQLQKTDWNWQVVIIFIVVVIMNNK